LSYGDDGFDPKALIKVGNSLEFCDITSTVNILNMEFENKIKKKRVIVKKVTPKFIYI
jgi:hypothetical protein